MKSKYVSNIRIDFERCYRYEIRVSEFTFRKLYFKIELGNDDGIIVWFNNQKEEVKHCLVTIYNETDLRIVLQV